MYVYNRACHCFIEGLETFLETAAEYVAHALIAIRKRLEI
jgi:hypothetical protein